MKEVITISFGKGANWTSAHFWEIQEKSQEDQEFHSPLFIEGQTGYCPRLVAVDFKEKVDLSQLYSKEEEVPWAGKVQTFEVQPSSVPKWSDLIINMLDLKNIVVAYEMYGAEGFEDSFRWVAEHSDSAQGIQFLWDNEMVQEIPRALEVVSDYYNKVPILGLGFSYKYSTEEALLLSELKDYSQFLHVPCTNAQESTHYQEVAEGLEVISYHCRFKEDMRTALAEFLTLSTGNMASLSVNENFYGPCQNPVYRKDYFHEVCGTASLHTDTEFYNFISEFIKPPSHNYDSEEVTEANNYLKDLRENFTQ